MHEKQAAQIKVWNINASISRSSQTQTHARDAKMRMHDKPKSTNSEIFRIIPVFVQVCNNISFAVCSFYEQRATCHEVAETICAVFKV